MHILAIDLLDVLQWTVIILAVFAFALGILILMSWGGPCKKCRSWKNWEEVRMQPDFDQDHVEWQITYTKCSKCGHTRDIASKYIWYGGRL